jgi:hypothetical protein
MYFMCRRGCGLAGTDLFPLSPPRVRSNRHARMRDLAAIRRARSLPLGVALGPPCGTVFKHQPLGNSSRHSANGPGEGGVRLAWVAVGVTKSTLLQLEDVHGAVGSQAAKQVRVARSQGPRRRGDPPSGPSASMAAIGSTNTSSIDGFFWRL